MTQYHYISSPKPLKTGVFGDNPIAPNVYASELDLLSLFIEDNYDVEDGKRFSYSKHFQYKCQVGMMSMSTPLKGEERGTPEEKKCLEILYKYIVDAVNENGIVEYFTSWNSEEDLPISERREISLSELKSPKDLIIADREFVTISKWNNSEYDIPDESFPQ